MPNVRMKVPDDLCSFSFDGEDVTVEDGHVSVSEKMAARMKSHGFTPVLAPIVAKQPVAKPVVEPDDEEVGDTETEETVDPATMNKDELKAFLRGEDVSIPRGSTVGDLRRLVQEHLNSKE